MAGTVACYRAGTTNWMNFIWLWEGKVEILPGDKYVVTGLHVKALLHFEFPELYRERNGVTLLHLLSELGEAS